MSILQRRGNWKQFLKQYPICSFLIVLNVLVFIIMMINRYTNLLTDLLNGYTLIQLGAIQTYTIDATGQFYRFLTAMFLHGNFLHILFNMFFGLIILGAALEGLIGSTRFFIVYFLTGIASSYGVYLLSGPYTVTVGASGAIYGILGVLLFMIVFKKTLVPYNDRKLIAQLIILNVILSFVLSGISLEGHLSGLIAGFLIAPLLMIKEPEHPSYL
ncbi:rhomboid family intramembrane serine protease [Haloplasma contractile]|uniref:4-hydroxythreonine-4-phosphate dehydrogenase protein n=1 Tax=Haloplasma contractile SSD-17B TaxID=1033810 RepID=F7Q0Q1_9MOLU|nr:rhomboid family intramembrane serine protease [Haloplasma contractile]ERJ11961.1 4-hydroxythreonine-4-phosphate dehydrogenase protein [Haloplasma contractile SSD-17B]